MTFTLQIKTADDLAAEAVAVAKANITSQIDAHVEAQAKSMGYNSAAACAGYKNSTIPEWAAEAKAFIAWRDAVWIAVFKAQAQAEVSKTLPDVADILAALPEYVS